MTPWDTAAARWRGRKDAEAGTFLGEEYIDQTLGPSPAWEPLDRHGPLVETLAREGELAEYRTILREAEEEPERAHAFPRSAYLAGGILLLLVEAVAMTHLLRDLGVPSGSRAVLGLTLAAFAIWIVHGMADAFRDRKERPGSRALRGTLGLFGFGLFAASIALLRLHEWGVAGRATLPEALFWIAATLGPALLAEMLLSRYVRAALPRHLGRTYGRERRRLEKAVVRARSERDRVLAAAERWERRRTRILAAYTRAFRIREAELPKEEETRSEPAGLLRSVTPHRREINQ